ncbi:magnesium chelatase, partial [Mycobacterium tuberculosis]
QQRGRGEAGPAARQAPDERPQGGQDSGGAQRRPQGRRGDADGPQHDERRTRQRQGRREAGEGPEAREAGRQ